ncbi:MAG: hypothetical protein ABR519_09130 [Bacteroidales bacterium]
MRTLLLYTILFVSSLLARGQEIADYDISVTFFPENPVMYGVPVEPDNYMRGVTTVTIGRQLTDTAVFWLHGELMVDSVTVDGKAHSFASEDVLYALNYSYIANRTVVSGINPGENRSLRVWYSGFMNPSRTRSLSDYMRIDRDEGVYLRSYGYSLWFPLFLDDSGDRGSADFRRVTVDLPAGFRAVITGDMISEQEENGRYRSEWHPGVTDIFEVQCTAAPFMVEERNGIRVCYRDSQEAAVAVLDYVAGLRDFCRDRLRPYADNRVFHIMEMPRYGNISSGNVIGLDTESFQTFPEMTWPKSIIAHELVHPYVQLPLAVNNPFYAFFIEGMPSFFQVYLLSGTLPPDIYNRDEVMHRVERSYIRKRETGTDSRGNKLPEEKALLEIRADEIGWYKDNFVLNDRMWLFMYELWSRMGESGFAGFLGDLLVLDDIDYPLFESIVISRLPGYEDRLHAWLRTTTFTDAMMIQ